MHEHTLWIALLPPAGGLWYSMIYSRTFESPWNQEEASLYVFCRINMQCWILLLTQWIGWTMLSGIPSWCSWILTVSRVWRTWGPDCVLSPGRVPGNSMSVHLNWERTTTTYSQVNTDVLRLCFLYCKKKWKKDWERQWGLVHMQKQTLVPKARWYYYSNYRPRHTEWGEENRSFEPHCFNGAAEQNNFVKCSWN